MPCLLTKACSGLTLSCRSSKSDADWQNRRLETARAGSDPSALLAALVTAIAITTDLSLETWRASLRPGLDGMLSDLPALCRYACTDALQSDLLEEAWSPPHHGLQSPSARWQHVCILVSTGPVNDGPNEKMLILVPVVRPTVQFPSQLPTGQQ